MASNELRQRLHAQQYSDQEWAQLEAEVTAVGEELAAHAEDLINQRGGNDDWDAPPDFETVTLQYAEASKEASDQYAAYKQLLKQHRIPIWGAVHAPASDAPAELKDAWQALTSATRRRDDLSGRALELARANREHQTQLAVIRAQAYRETLSAIRPMGGAVTVASESTKQARDSLATVASNFPSDWIEASNQGPSMRVVVTKARAHYQAQKFNQRRKFKGEGHHYEFQPEGWAPDPDDPRYEGWTNSGLHGNRGDEKGKVLWYGPKWECVTLTYREGEDQPPAPHSMRDRPMVAKRETITDPATGQPLHAVTWRQREYGRLQFSQYSLLTTDSESTTTHEFTHRCEHTNPVIGELSEAFVKRRTTNPDGTRQALVPYHHSTKEKVRPDHFKNIYMGKDYGDRQGHEVMSTGTEALFHGQYDGLRASPRPGDTEHEAGADDDMRHFVLGTLATA